MGEQDWMALPPVIHNNITLRLPNKLRKQYEILEAEFMLQFPQGVAEANSAAVLNSKLRQFVQGGLYIKEEIGMLPSGEWVMVHDLKVKALKSLVETSNGNPILAPVQFSFEYDMICKEFGYKVPLIAGKTSAAKTKEYIHQWNIGVLPLLIVHPRSVAYSLNLQFGGHIICWVALPWEADLYAQLLRRLRRPGQRAGRIIIHRIIFENSVDEKVGKALARKINYQEGLFQAMETTK
jgi:SNF2 family DNA or RNA helicase